MAADSGCCLSTAGCELGGAHHDAAAAAVSRHGGLGGRGGCGLRGPRLHPVYRAERGEGGVCAGGAGELGRALKWVHECSPLRDGLPAGLAFLCPLAHPRILHRWPQPAQQAQTPSRQRHAGLHGCMFSSLLLCQRQHIGSSPNHSAAGIKWLPAGAWHRCRWCGGQHTDRVSAMLCTLSCAAVPFKAGPPWRPVSRWLT